jgi:nucleoside-diphosphate-sugar epimerase
VRAADPEFVFHLARREGSDLREELAGSLAVASALAGAKRLVRWVRTAHATREGLGRGADAEIARALAARGPAPATIELYLPYGPGMNDGTWPLDLIDALAAGRPAPRAGAKDLLFVDDAAEGYRLAALTPAAEGRTIALGGGRLIPPSEVEDSARRALGLPSREGSSSAPTGPGHPADLSAARELLAWSPRTPLDEGLRVLVEWRHGRVRR